MELINETRIELLILTDYVGTCSECGTVLEYHENMIVIKLLDNEEVTEVVPLDKLTCPVCFHQIDFITNWKKLDVTHEFLKLKK